MYRQIEFGLLLQRRSPSKVANFCLPNTSSLTTLSCMNSLPTFVSWTPQAIDWFWSSLLMFNLCTESSHKVSSSIDHNVCSSSSSSSTSNSSPTGNSSYTSPCVWRLARWNRICLSPMTSSYRSPCCLWWTTMTITSTAVTSTWF
jgi:hypothetical protein